MGSVPGLTEISCTSPSPLSGGTYLGNSAGNTPLNSFNRWSNTPLCSLGRPNRCGTAPSGRSGSPYNNSWRAATGLPHLWTNSLWSGVAFQHLPCSCNKPTVPAGTWYLCHDPLHLSHILDNKGILPPYGSWDSQHGWQHCSIIHNHSVLPQHLGSVASFSLLLVPELTSMVLPSKALTPLIAVHTQLVAQYTHMKLGHISYTTIYSVLDKLSQLPCCLRENSWQLPD